MLNETPVVWDNNFFRKIAIKFNDQIRRICNFQNLKMKNDSVENSLVAKDEKREMSLEKTPR